MISIVQDEPSVLAPLSQKLRKQMSMVMANFEVGNDNDISGGKCTKHHGGEHPVKITDFKWTLNDSIEDDTPAEMIIDGVATSLDMCGDDTCTGCSMAHWSNDTTKQFPICTNYTIYKYSNKCKARQDLSMCGSDDDCFRSWPHDDRRKWKSDDFGCRPLPQRL